MPISAPPTGLDVCFFFIYLMSDFLAVGFSVSSGCARRPVCLPCRHLGSLIVVSVCISLMASDAEHLFICVWSPLYVFLVEVSVQVLCSFFNWVVCLSKEPASGFIDPLDCSFSLYVISVCSDLDYFLPSTHSGLCSLLFLWFL